MKYMNFRVRACNKAVAGEFSEAVTLETRGGRRGGGGGSRWEGVALMVAVPSVHVPAGCQHVPPEPARGGLQCGVGRHGRKGAGCEDKGEGREGQDCVARQLPRQVTAPSSAPGVGGGTGLTACLHPRAVQSPKRMSLGRAGRDRFTAESYTVLGESGSHGSRRGETWGTEMGGNVAAVCPQETP